MTILKTTRRRMMMGLAAATATASASATKAEAQESPELLSLAEQLEAVAARMIAAQQKVKAIVAELGAAVAYA